MLQIPPLLYLWLHHPPLKESSTRAQVVLGFSLSNRVVIHLGGRPGPFLRPPYQKYPAGNPWGQWHTLIWCTVTSASSGR